MVKKSSWIQSLFAWLLPATVGTAVGAGMIAVLSQPSLQTQDVLAALTLNPRVESGSFFSSEAPVRVKVKPKAKERDPGSEVPLVLPAGPAAPQTDAPPQVPARAPTLPKPWVWQPLVDDVALRFRTEIPDMGGLPLLYFAVLQDDPEWVSQLVANGANVNEVTPGGDTPLMAAIRHSAGDSVRALLYAGADPHQTGFEQQPPIAVASLRRGADLLRALTVAGADPNTRFHSPVSKAVLDRVTIKDLKHSLENDRGVTPLIACAARGDVEGATELIRAGAKSNLCTTRYKRYPINFAATQGYLFLMRIILGRQPDSEPQILVTINLTQQRAWVTKEGKIIDSCRVSTGRDGYDTPAGRYVITDKHRTWTSTIYHVPMPFFMRLNCSAIGLHSGYVTGRPASHGCIRLPYEKAQKFFALTRVGDEVEIVY
jgi:hypothetical protein